jgi:hypothetical protein
MTHYDTIREFRTPQFTVRVDATPDYDVDLSFDDDGSVRADLEAGNLASFLVRARVYVAGNLIAEDYLGGCIYRSLADFREPGGYFADMVHTVCREARSNLAALHGIKVREVTP